MSSSAEFITSQTNQWMQRRYEEQLDLSRSNNQTALIGIPLETDFGLIHFANNDRSSWYVRFSFKQDMRMQEEGDAQLHSRQQRTSSDRWSLRYIDLERLPIFENECHVMPVNQIESNSFEIDNNDGTESEVSIPIACKSEAAQIVHFMRNAWNLPIPELIISVTGGAKCFLIQSSGIHKIFQQEIVWTAIATKAWVFTAGTYYGIAKEVGDAFDKYRYTHATNALHIPLIGVVNWNATTDYKQLKQHQSTEPMQTQDVFNRTNKQRERLYRIRQPLNGEIPESYPLDPNHSYFLMLEDEFGDDDYKWRNRCRTSCRADLVLDLRAEIENESRNIVIDGEIYTLPIVQILVEGGLSSILTACESIAQKTPIIVLSGTGRAADLITSDYMYLYGEVSNDIRTREKYEQAMRKPKFRHYKEEGDLTVARRQSAILFQDSNRQTFIKMMTSIEGYFLLNFYDMRAKTTEQKLDDAILAAQFNETELTNNANESKTKKLKLAMSWKKYDRVINEILTDRTVSKWSNVELDKALSDAVHQCSVNFVEILIKHGASFERLRRFINIRDLYKNLNSDIQLPILRMLSRTTKKSTLQPFDPTAYYTKFLSPDSANHEMEIRQDANYATSEDTYGMIDGRQRDVLVSNKLLRFAINDAIRRSGHVTELSIHFSKDHFDPSQHELKPKIYLYIISTTTYTRKFVIIGRYQISNEQITKDSWTESILTIKIQEPTLYLETGQYLAVGFGSKSGYVYRVKSSDSYYIDLSTADAGLKTGEPVRFVKMAVYSATFKFKITPAGGFIRDLFLWSVGAGHFDLATCLCSHSENTIVAALLASIIYRRAAEMENSLDKKKDFSQKEKDFNTHAAQLIEKCFETDEEFALGLLKIKSNLYFDCSPLQLANENCSQSFLATKCVQKYLDTIWFGEINNKGHTKYFISLLIFFLCVCPILIPLVPYISPILALQEEKIGCFATVKKSFSRFYHKRAIVRFHYNIIVNVIFMCLFSFVLLVNFFPLNNNGGKRSGSHYLPIPITEIVVHFCMWSIIIEETIQFYRYYQRKRPLNVLWIIWKYLMDDKWNLLDLLAILFYLVGFFTRLIVNEQFFITTKICMCITHFLWYIRILHFFAASERLGTKLLMIFNTLKDLWFFICFILVFLIGYSITSYSLVTTKEQVTWKKRLDNRSSTEYSLAKNGTELWNVLILRNFIHWGMWKVYGQVELLDHSQVDNSKINTDDDAYGHTAFILTIIFVCIANVLLLNVLVALFNVTLDKTKHNAHTSWAYQRFLLVNEYSKKSTLPPLFNIIYYIYKVYHRLVHSAQEKLRHDIHGSLDNSSGLDSNLYDAITFNAMDQVKIAGRIAEVSINFSTAPTAKQPEIWLFVIKSVTVVTNPNSFEIRQMFQVKPNQITTQTGEQTFNEIDLFVEVNDYLAIRFSPGAGNPFTTKRDQYYSYIDGEPYERQKLLFTTCPTQGIAMRFYVEPLISTPKQRKLCCQIRKQSTTKYKEDREDILHAKRTIFQSHDNILRELSIAQQYWEKTIDLIKQKEKEESQ